MRKSSEVLADGPAITLHTDRSSTPKRSHAPTRIRKDRQRPTPVLHLHDTAYRYLGDADPTKPGGMAAIYRDLVADDAASPRSSM